MMHDPFQAYATLGSIYGMQNPFGSPYQGQQGGGFNPIGQFGGFQQGGQQQFGQYPGQSQFGQYPGQGQFGQQQVQQQLQQLQLVSALSSLGIPPLLAAALVNNPQIAATLHSSGLNPNLGQQFGSQQHSPYQQLGQMGSPFGQQGYPLAPQSWIGQAGLFGGAQGFGGIQPQFSQWGQRPFQAQGLSPWGY